MGEKKKQLYNNVRILNNYVKKYKKINGAIFGFTVDGINKYDLQITGLLYNPQKKFWETKKLPFPGSIIKRRLITQEWREYLNYFYPDGIYNYKPLDKWQVYKRLIQFKELSDFLPPTDLVNKFSDITDFLLQHKNIYLKPSNGNRGIGIYNIIQYKDKVTVQSRGKDTNHIWEFDSHEELVNFLEENLKKEQYIIQKTLNLKVDNKSIDFRVGLDKDQTGNWKRNMFVARISGENSIVSNVARSEGTVKYPLEALCDLYNFSPSVAKDFEQKLKDLGAKVGRAIDDTGLHFGKLALDIAIDNESKLWIIEVNNKSPNDTIMRLLGDKDKFYQIRLTNMLYAKKLSGFEIHTNENFLNFNLKEEQDLNLNQKIESKIYISIPGKQKKFKDYINELDKVYDLSIKFIEPIKKRRIVIVKVEGVKETFYKFIEEINKGMYKNNIKGIALKDMKVLSNE
nr:YheC/YheD family protein [Allobacillus saliphilus]